MIWTERIEFATTQPGARDRMEDRPDAISALVRALQTADSSDIAADVHAYANEMVNKTNPLRQAIGTDHAALSEDVSDLTHRARDLLLGMLGE